MQPTKAYAAHGPTTPFVPHTIQRREPTAQDVQIRILFCGVCHSDLHAVRNEWASFLPTTYPIVPGHEIVGRVTKVGSAVSGFQVGDLVGVGCLVDSDGTCPECRTGNENNCMNGVFTYNMPDRHSGGVTYGGYSAGIVVDQRFVLRIPANLDPAGAAPLLCAGITTWSPLRQWGIGPGSRVGVVGLGGLGHMAVKFARAFGAHVVVFTTSPKKVDPARQLGAHEAVLSTDAAAIAARMGSFDFVLDTVSDDHDVNPYLGLLRPRGTLTLVGAPQKPLAVSAFSLLMGRRNLSGSNIGGIRETQEMLDFCGRHGITADVEVIPIQRIGEAYERMLKGDVRYRFSIDLSSLG